MMTTSATKQAPTALRKTAFIAGALYLMTFVTSMPALALYAPVLNNPEHIARAGTDSGALLGAFLEVLLALSGIGTALALYPVVKRQNQGLALGFLASRILEASLIVVGVISVLSLVTLRPDTAGAAGTDPASLLPVGKALVAIHNWTFLLGPGVMSGVNALLLGSLMYRSRLVPRAIPLMGLLGAPLFFVSATAVLFGVYQQVSVWSAIATIPVAAWEFSLGVWLVVKGFRPSPITSRIAERVGTDRELTPV